MRQNRDLTGQRFGRLVVVKQEISKNTHNSYWECICDCGKSTVVCRPGLIQGRTQSCGCLHKEISSKISQNYNKTHGESRGIKEYRAWHSMKDRCLCKNNTNYHNYGGRGITVCSRWLESYENFLTDMGRCPDGMSLDRLDNMKGYDKNNCRWATMEEQNNNTRQNIFLTYNGITLTIAQWARKIGMKKITLWQRIKYFGCSPEEALTLPVTPNGKGLRK